MDLTSETVMVRPSWGGFGWGDGWALDSVPCPRHPNGNHGQGPSSDGQQPGERRFLGLLDRGGRGHPERVARLVLSVVVQVLSDGHEAVERGAADVLVGRAAEQAVQRGLAVR